MSNQKTHELKTWPVYFEAVLTGAKPFECRKHDRPFNVDDILFLREWEPDKSEYTGRDCLRRVTYLLSGWEGLQQGYVVLGLSKKYRQNICRECKKLFWHEKEIDVCSEMCWRKGMEKAYDAHK